MQLPFPARTSTHLVRLILSALILSALAGCQTMKGWFDWLPLIGDGSETPGGERKPSAALKVEGPLIKLNAVTWFRCGLGQAPFSGGCNGETATVNWYRAAQYCTELQYRSIKWRLPSGAEARALMAASPDVRQLNGAPNGLLWTDESFQDSSRSRVVVDVIRNIESGELLWRNAGALCVAASSPGPDSAPVEAAPAELAPTPEAAGTEQGRTTPGSD